MTNMQFFDNKIVLVTGGAGFIGGALIEYLLLKTNSIVINIDKLGYASDLTRINQILCTDNITNNRYQFFQIDLKDSNRVKDFIIKIRPDLIFNLAAESHVDRSINSPEDFLTNNVIGTFNLLEATRSYWQNLTMEAKNSFRFLQVSTDEVFGSLGVTGLFSEKTPYNPRSPYSASKASSDHFVRAYFYTYKIPILLTNCSNNYGPWQFPEKLIPVIVSHALSSRDIPIYGDGNYIRDWLYVEDHVEALIKVMQFGEVGDQYCIGGTEEHKNIKIAKNICEILDVIQPRNEPYSNLIKSVKDRLGHDRRYGIDSSKIKLKLNWEPKFGFKEGLMKTVLWYSENQSWCDQVLSLHKE